MGSVGLAVAVPEVELVTDSEGKADLLSLGDTEDEVVEAEGDRLKESDEDSDGEAESEGDSLI